MSQFHFPYSLFPETPRSFNLGSSDFPWLGVYTDTITVTTRATVPTPVNTTDAATKAYVDSLFNPVLATIEEADGSPSITNATTLRFDQADGLVLTNPSAGVARLDLSAIPNAVLANSSITVTLGTGIVAGGGVTSLGGSVSIAVDTAATFAWTNTHSFIPTTQTGTASVQAVEADLTLGAGYGSNTATAPVYAAAVMGNVLGTNLARTENIVGGVIGKYDITGTNASTKGKAGVIGEVGDQASSADAAFLAILGGDTGTTTPGAAFGVMHQASTAASKFSFGLDLYRAAIGSYTAVSYGTAAIRVPNAAWVVARNAADSANVNIIRLDTANNVAFGADLSSPTILTPTIASFVNATHSHQNAAGGGTLDAAAIAAGTMATARLGSGSATASTFLRGDSSWAAVTTGISNSAVGTFSISAGASGAQSVTGLGFQPTVLFVMAVGGVSGASFGAVSSAGAENCIEMPTDSVEWKGNGGEMIRVLNDATTQYQRGDFTSFDSGGFTWSNTTAGGGYALTCVYLALR